MSREVENFHNSIDTIADRTTLIEIKQQYDFNKKTLHVFVEDENDFEFYKKSIEYIYRDYNIISYPKKGKKNVLASYDILDWNLYNKSRILFFVDKDYEDFLGKNSKIDRNIFVTKYYSIENYISCKKTFKYVLEEIYKIKSEAIVNELLEKFKISYEKFEEYLLYLTAIILIYRKKEIHMELNELKMDDFFVIKKLELTLMKYRQEKKFIEIKRSKLCSNYEKEIIKNIKTAELLKKTNADLTHISYKTIIENIRKLKLIKEGRCYIRGKYHLWFFLKCVNNIVSIKDVINSKIDEINKINGNEIKKINLAIVLNESNVFDILPMKIDMHNDINIFLIQNKQLINAKY